MDALGSKNRQCRGLVFALGAWSSSVEHARYHAIACVGLNRQQISEFEVWVCTCFDHIHQFWITEDGKISAVAIQSIIVTRGPIKDSSCGFVAALWSNLEWYEDVWSVGQTWKLVCSFWSWFHAFTTFFSLLQTSSDIEARFEGSHKEHHIGSLWVWRSAVQSLSLAKLDMALPGDAWGTCFMQIGSNRNK